MKILISWLKDFVDIDVSPEILADKLVSCGFEIEEIIYERDALKNIVVGKILTVDKHPNANKLLLTTIDVGKKVLQIATSATNIKVGDLVPVAMDGAKLGEISIKSGEMRGVLSEGMMCGGEELGLTDMDYPGASVNGILILKNSEKVGADINDVIGTTDVVLDVSITANRPDCNSIIGIAREVAAVTNKPFKMPDLTFKSVRKVPDFRGVEVKQTALCPRYMAQIVENVKITASPEIIRRRLKSMGLRPINNIVDITNYVLLEVGQPMHAFDLDLLNDKRIEVRYATAGETIVALDGKKYTLSADQLVIADGKCPVAIAGVMGGAESSVHANTQQIVFESARFARDSVRHTSKALNLRSDSSARFEKNVDFYAQEVGLARALHLIDQYGWGTVVGIAFDTNPNHQEKVVSTTPEAINHILGIEVPTNTMLDVLNSLQIKTEFLDGNLVASIPLFREDIDGKNDLAEEVIRIYGYEHIQPTLLQNGTMVKGQRTKQQEAERKIKNILVGKGFFETVTYSFVSPKIFDLLRIGQDDVMRNVIKVVNPIGEDFSVMRTTLAHSAIKTMASNLLKGNKSGKFFEVAKVYLPKQLPITEYPDEVNRLSLAAYGDAVDFYAFKSVVEDLLSTLGIDASFVRTTKPFLHDTRTAMVQLKDGTVLGYLGEVHPTVADAYDVDKRLYFAELDFEFLTQNTVTQRPFAPYSKFQAAERDLAVLVGRDTEASAILNAIYSAGSANLESAEIFDVYQGSQVAASKKSVAVKLVLRNLERTLTDAEISESVAVVLKALEQSVGATLR